LYGGAGNDTLLGGNSDDTLYGGSGNDALSGSTSGDTLYGGSGSDTLDGGVGKDVLIGGYGADTIIGGGASDTIRYLSLRDTGDTILGFESGDTLDLSAIDAKGSTSTNDAFAWGGQQSGQFVQAHSVTWFKDDGNVVVLVDTDGILTTAEFSITLVGVTTLSADDFNTL
jgi:Ca2+-binding RTX toxin-like protein